MRSIEKWFAPCATVAAALLAWAAAMPGASAQTPPADGTRSPIIDEVRFGALVHNVEPANDEDGVDLNLEVLFRRAAIQYNNAFLDVVLRPRIHLGASINLGGDTSQLYAGFTWDVKLAPRLSFEVAFGGALHDGPTGDGHADSYGCPLNFRESASVGYALDERWSIYGTVAHMSNANLCDHNSGLTSVGMRLGYKLQ
jgi:lipid A 3-O-deacylase